MERVRISEDEWNYKKDDGNYIFDKHVKYCYYFNEGFGLIRYNDYKLNFINLEGKELLKNSFNSGWGFENGFANIRINNVWYYIDKECNFYNDKDKISFKELYNEYPNMRSELIEIIKKYTYHDTNEYFV